MLKLLTAPATNDRSPRYMERALAAIHQADRDREPLTLIYATTGGRIGLFLRFAEHAEELVTGPVAANYPNCALTAAGEPDDAPPDWRTWFSELELTPELFPILRHVQFEDMINRTFADPITAILRAIKSDADVQCQIEIQIVPAGPRRRRRARRAIRLLDREFFRIHYRLADYFAEHNCGTLLSFRVGLEDAELLAPAMSKHPGQLTPADLSNLPNYTAYARLLIEGHPSRPFSLRTLPPVPPQTDEDRGEIVRRAARHRYAKPVEAVELSLSQPTSPQSVVATANQTAEETFWAR